MSKMLLGETQEDFATAIKEYFTIQHFSVDVETQGNRILECLRQNSYDVAILEIVLPGLNTIDIIRGFRASGGKIPILLMSSRHSSEDLQDGLDAGADSYLVKPFQLSDLAAQVRALMRRPAFRSEKVLMSGNIAVNTEEGTVRKNNELIHLYPMEYKLLRFLLAHPNQVFSQDAIFERVWQKDSSNLQDTVRTHIRTLRQKIDDDPERSIITTVRGLGYKADLF
ncbi:MAG: response regulator transcription factor [Candidatus Melainabacteria bacterium]|nr:response regulator transcription factor [Candidatus Melainabacteria bacterium]